jgi:AcrR family transcriptional regulator
MTKSVRRQEPNDAPAPKRPYQLGKRVGGVAETRARVIQATRDMLTEDDCQTLSMDAIARRAGVARGTLYHQFTSKFDLLSAVVADTIERVGFQRVRTIRDQSDACVALREYVPALCAFYAGVHVMLRNLFGLVAIDVDADRLMQLYNANRHAALQRMMKRLMDDGHLSAEFTRDEAVEMLWMLTSFRTFDHLYGDSALPLANVSSLLSRLANRVLAPGV